MRLGSISSLSFVGSDPRVGVESSSWSLFLCDAGFFTFFIRRVTRGTFLNAAHFPIGLGGANTNRGEICLGGTPDFPLSYFLHEKILRRGVPTLLARINEPPLGGGGCNICSSENLETREVTFALSRDVYEGEELFMDYGLTYDRSSYGGD